MKIAVIGSREFDYFDLSTYIPEEVTEIISGGAVGIDSIARIFAEKNGIKYTEFAPEYAKYGKKAPLIRNIDIIRNADMVLAFWDGSSRGTKFVIDKCRLYNIPVTVFMISQNEDTPNKLSCEAFNTDSIRENTSESYPYFDDSVDFDDYLDFDNYLDNEEYTDFDD